jgi:hypothetical protein
MLGGQEEINGGRIVKTATLVYAWTMSTAQEKAALRTWLARLRSTSASYWPKSRL